MKVKFCAQRDMMDCGAACLQSICQHYGKEIELLHIRNLCHITRNGVSMLGIADAAEALGLNTIGVKLTWEQLCKDAHLPCIIHWNQRHFVVVAKIRNDIVTVMDPAIGILKYKKTDFQKCWLQLSGTNVAEKMGAALLLSPTAKFYSSTKEKHSGASTQISALLKHLRPFRSRMAIITLTMLIGCAVSVIFPYLTKEIVDTGIKNSDLGYISLILIAELALLIGLLVNNVIRSRLMLSLTTGISIELISGFLGRLMALPITFFDTKHIGDIIQRIKDFSRIEEFLTETLLSLLLSVATFAIYGAMMLNFSLTILIIFLLGSALYVGWVTIFLKKQKRLDYTMFQLLAGNESNLIQLVNGMQEIKLNSCERKKRWEWERLQNQIFKLKRYGLRLQNTQSTGAAMIDQAKNLIIVFLAAKGVVDGNITVGELVAIQYIIGQLNAPLHQFVSFLRSLQDAKISMERMGEISSVTEEEKLFSHIRQGNASGGYIRLDHVSFQYDGPRSSKVLNDVSFTVPQGKVTAIVGMSGSGKTTILKLMLSFFYPTEGDILIGETPLKHISPKEWRKHCGVVMQDGFLFSDTIENNIALSDGEIDACRVVRAAKIACIHEHIMSLPMKYNTRIGADGHGLSAGQNQRLLIARAVYKNPEYIFLDEATNSLDTTNEVNILCALQSFFKGKTVVIVAHRLSTIKNADNIVVLANGRVAEQGTHQQLIANQKEYYTLIKNQVDHVG